MMDIDWEKFKRVPVGTMVRELAIDGRIMSQGVLLENYPYCQDELIEYVGADTAKQWAEKFHESPQLRYQNFKHTHVGILLLCSEGVQFLIAGEWLTFEQVMA